MRVPCCLHGSLDLRRLKFDVAEENRVSHDVDDLEILKHHDSL